MKILLIVLAFSLPSIGIAQNNQVKGKVFLPEIKKKITIKRGANYRNRIKKKPSKKTGNDAIHLIEQTIISVEPISFEAPQMKHVVDLNQIDKAFVPSILAVTKGATVRFINKDSFYHNVFSLTPKAKFNIGRRAPGKIIEKVIKKTGIIKVFCDIHPQMNALIISLETPYFTKVNKEGRYQLNKLPNGKYRLHFFHPKLTVPSQIIELQNGTTIEKDFNIGPDSKSAALMPTGQIRLTADGSMLALCKEEK